MAWRRRICGCEQGRAAAARRLGENGDSVSTAAVDEKEKLEIQPYS
jgi:hypothetical protein